MSGFDYSLKFGIYWIRKLDMNGELRVFSSLLNRLV